MVNREIEAYNDVFETSDKKIHFSLSGNGVENCNYGYIRCWVFGCKMPVHDSEVVLCNRMISTYVNALAKAGFVIEQMIEQNTSDMDDTSDKEQKANKRNGLFGTFTLD